MNRKQKIGWVIVLIIVLVALIGLAILGLSRWKQGGVSIFTRSQPHYNDRLINSPTDLTKLSTPPPTIPKQEDLQTLVDRIASLNFPECYQVRDQKGTKCDDLAFRGNFNLCMKRVEYEIGRISQIRDKNLVPELIKVAEKRKYRYGFLQGQACEEMKREFLQHICWTRFTAIDDLGEIKDPRAVDPLLKLLDEPPPSFAEPTEGLLESCAMPIAGGMGYTCGIALQALLKMGVAEAKEGLAPELLKALDEIKDQPVTDLDQNFYEAARAGCKVEAASLGGSEALNEMVNIFLQPGTSEAKKGTIIASIALIRDPKAIPKLKELMHQPELDPHMYGTQGTLSSAAARALSGMARPELIKEYIWMLENGFPGDGGYALGEIKDPSTIPPLINILSTSMGQGDLEDNLKTNSIADALGKMGPIARESAPSLVESLQNCNISSCRHIIEALGTIGDDTAVEALYNFVLGNTITGKDQAILSLGKIGSDSAIKALKEIILDKNRPKQNIVSENFDALRITSIQTLWQLRGNEENSFFCEVKEKEDPQTVGFYLKDKCKESPK